MNTDKTLTLLQRFIRFGMLITLGFTLPVRSDPTTQVILFYGIAFFGLLGGGMFLGVILSDEVLQPSLIERFPDNDPRNVLFLVSSSLFMIYAYLRLTPPTQYLFESLLGAVVLFLVSVIAGFEANTRYRNGQQPFQKYEWYPDRTILFPLAPFYALRYYLNHGHF